MSDLNTSADLTLKDFRLQDLYHAMLEEPEMAKTLKDIDIIMMQNCMEEIIHGEVGRKEPNGLDFHEETREIMYAKDCVDNEFAELLRLLPFKSWKISQYEKMTDIDVNHILEKTGKDMSMELIDLWFFFIIMSIRVLHLLGLPIEEKSIKALYCIKFIENIERIKSGSFDEKRKPTEKEEKMIQLAAEIRNIIIKK